MKKIFFSALLFAALGCGIMTSDAMAAKSKDNWCPPGQYTPCDMFGNCLSCRACPNPNHCPSDVRPIHKSQIEK